MGLVSELRRRNVFRVAIAYVIIAWLILQVGDTLAPALHLADWVNTVLAFFLILGFPIALIFAWAYELTPEGLKKEKEVDSGQSITHVTGRKLDYLIIAVLAVALGFFAFDKFVLDASREAELVRSTTKAVTEQAAEAEAADKSIAVLAFADLSPEGDQEYFSDGISEEILNVLSRIPGLQVTSRSSAFSYKGKSVHIPTVAKQLGVANVLEGSVRKSGKRIRITAQLIDARTDTHIWSETYDRDLEDIFALQDEISGAIVMALREHLGLQVEVAPRVIAAANTEAHEAYLRGRHLVVQRGTAVEGAVREFEKAMAFDPDYALAHAELAIATLLLIQGQHGNLTISEAGARAAPHVERAMALDPTLAEAHAATGRLAEDQGNREKALRHYKQAIQINPSYSDVYNWMGIFYSEIGSYKEAFAMTEVAVRLDPLSGVANWNYLLKLINRGRLDEAALQTEKMISLEPDDEIFYRGMLSSVGGKWTDYLVSRLDQLWRHPGNPYSERRLTWQFALIGLEQEALTISEYVQPYVLRWLGRPGDAVKTAEAHLAENPESLNARGALGLALASAGDYARARPILEEEWQRLGRRVTCCDIGYSGFPAHSAAALIVIRQSAGEKSGVAELVAAIRENVRHYQEAGLIIDSLHHSRSIDYETGLADFLSGERDKGLALIGRAVDDGFFIPPNEAYLQALYDDPGFVPIRVTQEARQKRERERLLAIVCTDNPYEAVWQPAEGTCKDFAAASGN